MKKGLRPSSSSLQNDSIRNGHRPYEEGIKTSCALPIRHGQQNGHRPYEEGIKTTNSGENRFPNLERTQTL